jgi:aryl-alcohol dehydrogenase-like predicted oxidoreductase
MQKRKLGKSNLEASAIGLGCLGARQDLPDFYETLRTFSLINVNPVV